MSRTSVDQEAPRGVNLKSSEIRVTHKNNGAKLNGAGLLLVLVAAAAAAADADADAADADADASPASFRSGYHPRARAPAPGVQGWGGAGRGGAGRGGAGRGGTGREGAGRGGAGREGAGRGGNLKGREGAGRGGVGRTLVSLGYQVAGVDFTVTWSFSRSGESVGTCVSHHGQDQRICPEYRQDRLAAETGSAVVRLLSNLTKMAASEPELPETDFVLNLGDVPIVCPD